MGTQKNPFELLVRVNDKEDEDDADETMVPNIVIAREQMRLPYPFIPQHRLECILT